MSRFRVVVTDQVFPSTDIERGLLAEIDAELEVADGTRDGVAARAADADALLNTYLPIDAGLIRELRRCRVIARYGIGIDNVDVTAAHRAGIVVTNVPDYCVEEVAVHTTAMILALVRRLPVADARVRSGAWGIEPLRPMARFSELTFGLVGFGRIGRRVAQALGALGGRVIVHDPLLAPSADMAPHADLAAFVSLDELVASSDVISIHAPATPETRGLFDAPRLARMRRGAILVNTSRGPLVVLDDLIDALRAGQVGGAGLDVFEVEPPAAEALLDVPNLLLSPHMAYYSEASIAESQHKAARQVVQVLRGLEPDYPVRS